MNYLILANPTLQKVRFTISELLMGVQQQTRSRKVKTPDNYALEPIWQKPEGVLQWNGGAPDKSDGGYSTGQTSRLGVAWWTDRNKNLHVRVEVDRTQASNFSVPDIFALIHHPFHVIFPHHDPTYCVRCNYKVPPGEGHWAGDDRFACDPCIEEDRYLLETTFLPSGRRKKKR